MHHKVVEVMVALEVVELDPTLLEDQELLLNQDNLEILDHLLEVDL
jgi:hypothetical protein